MIRYMPLSDVCRIIDCPHETPEWKSEGIPVIRNFNLVNGQIDMSDGYYVDEDTFIRRTRRAVPTEGDIIFSREAPIGNCGIVPKDFKCCLGQRLVLLQVNHKICSSEYLLAVLQSSFVLQQIAQVSKSGSIVSNFAIGDLQDLVIPILDNQDDIARLSNTIAEKLSNNTSLSEVLGSMARLLYDYWFVQFDFPDENGKPYKSSGGKMVWNDDLKREIPEGWEVKDILKVCDVVDCLHSKKPDYCYEDEDSYLLTLENLTKDGHIDLSEKYYISKNDYKNWISRIEVKEGDFVVTNAGRAGDIGRIPKNVKCAIGRNMTAIHPTKIDSFYLNMFLHSYYVKSQIMSNLDQGSFFMSLNVHAIKKLKILIPDYRILTKAIDRFSDLIVRIENLQEENQQLASFRDFLLPMLMNGQVKMER